MGLFKKLTSKMANARSNGGNDKKYLLVCPNCGKKLVVRIAFDGVSITGKSSYRVIDNETNEVIRKMTFNQAAAKGYGQGCFDYLLNAIDCPECGISMNSCTQFKK